MPNMMIRHPSWTNVVKTDGGISLEWSSYFTMADKVITPLTKVPAADLNNLGSTLSGLNAAIAGTGYDDLASALEGMQLQINTLIAGYDDLLIYSYQKADLPASARVNKLVHVPNAAGGNVIAFWDGSAWRGVDGTLV